MLDKRNLILNFGLCLFLFTLPVLWRTVRFNKAVSLKPEFMRLAIGFCIAFSFGTLVNLYPNSGFVPGGDSAVFLYIGRELSEGKLPYRDLFDHKGPLLYLIEYLGMSLIPPPRLFTGVWLLEILNMALSVCFLLKCCEQLSLRQSSAALAMMLTFLVCGRCIFEGGNYSEEYALPWISFALLVFLRFFRTGAYRPGEIIALGFCFGAVFLLRPNMIGVWAALMPLVLLRFLSRRQYRDIFLCTLAFLSGFALCIAPVVLFARLHGFLEDMWRDYILFNLIYTDSMALSVSGYLGLTRAFLLRLWPGVLGLLVALLLYHREKTVWLCLWGFLVSLFLAQLSGRDYSHYLITALPVLSIPLAFLFEGIDRRLLSKHTLTDPTPRRHDSRRFLSQILEKPPAFLRLLSCIRLHFRFPICLRRSRRRFSDTDGTVHPLVLLLTCLLILGGSVGYHQFSRPDPPPDGELVRYLKENTQRSDDVLILGNCAYPYLAADRSTHNRFFYQTPPITLSDYVLQSFLFELSAHPSDFIIDPFPSPARDGWRETVHSTLREQGYTETVYEGFTVFTKR